MATKSPVSVAQTAAAVASTAAVASGQKGKQNGSLNISCDILDDLASRFIINVPVEERENLIRICFQMELAHWFYLDFYCAENKHKCGIKQFAQQMFKVRNSAVISKGRFSDPANASSFPLSMCRSCSRTGQTWTRCWRTGSSTS